ncbi:hypothetical protein Dimus_031763, partial [Dionaea muscipula]
CYFRKNFLFKTQNLVLFNPQPTRTLISLLNHPHLPQSWRRKMAEEEEEEISQSMLPSLPIGRVKKIVKLDGEINKLTSEALFLISCSTELFLQFLSERSAEVAAEKKRKIINVDHLRLAVKGHQPSSDFLLDSLAPPPSSKTSDGPANYHAPSKAGKSKPPPAGARRIDSFFSKNGNAAPKGVGDSDGGAADCLDVPEDGDAVCIVQSEGEAPEFVIKSASGAVDCVDES